MILIWQGRCAFGDTVLSGIEGFIGAGKAMFALVERFEARGKFLVHYRWISFVMTAALTGMMTLQCTVASANEWRWAKPLNQKVGSLFYSSTARIKPADTRGIGPSVERSQFKRRRVKDLNPRVFRFRSKRSR